MDMDKYTRKSLEVIEKAKDKALEYDNQELAQIHLLAGLLEIDESLISKIFEKLDIDVTAAVNRVEDKLASLPKVSGGNLYAGNNFSKALIQAEKEAKQMGDSPCHGCTDRAGYRSSQSEKIRSQSPLRKFRVQNRKSESDREPY